MRTRHIEEFGLEQNIRQYEQVSNSCMAKTSHAGPRYRAAPTHQDARDAYHDVQAHDAKHKGM